MDLALKGQIVHLKSKVVSIGLNVEEDWQRLKSPERWKKDIEKYSKCWMKWSQDNKNY